MLWHLAQRDVRRARAIYSKCKSTGRRARDFFLSRPIPKPPQRESNRRHVDLVYFLLLFVRRRRLFSAALHSPGP